MNRLLCAVAVLLVAVPACLQAQCYPEFMVEKTADPMVAAVDVTVTFTITVTNTGTCDLTVENVDDSRVGDLTWYFSGTLHPGEAKDYVYTYTLEATDPDPLVNAVTVVCMDESGIPYEYQHEVAVDLVHPELVTAVECLTGPVPPGEEVEFALTITNAGDVDMIFTTTEPEFPGPYTILQAEVWEFVWSEVCEGGEVCATVDVLGVLPPEYQFDTQYPSSDSHCCQCTGSPVEEHTWGRLKALYREQAGD